MKIALIGPSNMLYMPYMNNYETILKANNVDYDIINWDRFNIEDSNNYLRYRDMKVGHQRKILDYYKYRKFIINRLNKTNYDKVIVFGIQLTFFLKGILLGKFNGKYIVDIRDYNEIINFFDICKVINNSSFTVISSPGYKEWLPYSDKYIINHNTQVNNLEELKEIICLSNKRKIKIAYIGAIRDYKLNIDFIKALINNKKIDLYFHGEGDINKKILKYLDDNCIHNVYLNGRYEKDSEYDLYKQSDLINVLLPNNNINSKTLLPNRLYNAVLHGKPIISFRETYLAEQVEKYKLGLILKKIDNVDMQIEKYLKEFSSNDYKNGRTNFFDEVIKENQYFISSIEKYIKI